MKLVSWNVNGLRACIRKGFFDYFKEVDADIFCIQETKMQQSQIEFELDGYEMYWNDALKKGYSGTAVFTKQRPLQVLYGMNGETSEDEGRVLTLEFPTFYVVNSYTPNAKRDLSRLAYRLEWEDRIRQHLLTLNEQKPVIYCGDLNVAHQEIDIRNVKSNIGNSGFTYEERDKMSTLLNAGFIDTFRYFYPNQEGAYTWWSYMNGVRERNIGWRIDYFLVSERLQKQLRSAEIHHEVLGSDHCPILLQIDPPETILEC